jgi:hypothetical protein
MNANASKAQLDALGVTGVTDANLTSILAALDAATDTSELNTLANVQTVVTDAVNALSAISTAAQNNTANGTTVATAAQYDALGITGMGGTGQPTVAMINSVLNDLDIGSTQTETAAKVQAIVNAYQAILQSTDGVANNDSDNPTQTQYSTVGVNGVDTAQEESLLGDVLDTASRDGTNTDASAVDSVAKIQALATAVQAVMNANASKAQLDALGVTGVTDANLTSILAALDAATDTSELNTLANVQTVVTDAVNALSAISTAAQNNTANGTTVATAAQYDALGITGMGGTGQPTVAMINSVLNDLDIGSTQTETAAKVQAIVNAYQAILDSTDGVANNDSDNPTQTQYSTVGVNGVDTAQEESLLGDVLDTASRDGTNTDASAVDSVAKIQALATAVQAVMNANASKAQLDALGVTGVTDANLTSILAALDAATDTSELNTLANVQTVVTDAVNALSAISTAAQNNTANGTTVATAAQYDALGITGMGGTGQPTVAMINSVLNDLDIGSTQTETAAKVQAIVNAYQAILQSTDGVANNDSDNPTQTQYSTVGVNGVDTAQEESLLGDVLDTASRDGTNTDASAVDSVAKIQALATAVQAVMNANASKAQLDALGVTGVTDANLTSILAALDAADDATQLNTLAGLQTIVDAPTIQSVSISPQTDALQNTPQNSICWGAAETIYFDVVFSEAVTVAGEPTLAINIGGTTVQASYSTGSGTSTLKFSYTVATGDNAPDGISIGADSLSLSGSTIKDSANNNATLAHTGMEADINHKVDAKGPAAIDLNSATTGVQDSTTQPYPQSDLGSSKFIFPSLAEGGTDDGVKSIEVVLDGSGLDTTHDKLILMEGANTVAETLNLSGTTASHRVVTLGGISNIRWDYTGTTGKKLTLTKNDNTVITAAEAQTLAKALKFSTNNGTTTSTTDGVRTFRITYLDEFANESTPATATIGVDTVVPTTTLSDLTFSADTGNSGTDFITRTAAQTITATLGAELNTGEKLRASLNNGSTWTDVTSFVKNNTKLEWTGATLVAGANTLKLKVTDLNGSGNDGPILSQSYTLDTTAPTLNANTAPATKTTGGGDSVGDTIELTVTFDSAVYGLTSGTNSTIFQLGTTGVSATWSGTNGSTTRTLTYTVAAGDSGVANIVEANLKTALEAGITDLAANAFTYTANSGVIPDIDIDSTALPTVEARDTTAPTLVSSTPSDNGLIAATATSITLTFSEAIKKGSGTFTVSNSGGALKTYTIGGAFDSDATISGSVLTLSGLTLSADTNYHVLVGANAITDLANNPYAGIERHHHAQLRHPGHGRRRRAREDWPGHGHRRLCHQRPIGR